MMSDQYEYDVAVSTANGISLQRAVNLNHVEVFLENALKEPGVDLVTVSVMKVRKTGFRK